MQKTQPYRSDIDGLRAVAVLSVVLYHFGAPLPGGFVGVDVFFVISGFLIGGILWRDYDGTGRVDLLGFYMRRFRRLLPAFTVMAVCVTALAWAILLPFEFRDYGKQLIAASVYLSNVLFYTDVGYFDAAADSKPLLHTWSLAVEEQFYIVLPLFMLLLARSRQAVLTGLVLCWGASLVACVWLTPGHAPATFYLFPFRAWELLSGVLLAIWGYENGWRWRGHPALSVTGIAMILGAVLFMPADAVFPGLWAVLPVLGTVLVLSSGTGLNPVNRMLCHRVPVFFGLISYSLYLWHWPVLTLSSYLRDGYAHVAETVGWMALSGILAWLSWRFVEQPVRRAQGLGHRALLGGAVLASSLTLALGALLYLRDGLPGRFGPEAQMHIAATQDFLQDWSRCTTPDRGPLMGIETCPIGPEGTPRVLVWGDSHVRAFHAGLDAAAHRAGTPALVIWRAGCAPVLGLRKTESAATAAQNLACHRQNEQMSQAFGRIEGIERILLIGRWAYYAEGSGIGVDSHNTIVLTPDEGPLRTDQAQADLFEQAARASIAHLLTWYDDISVLRQVPEIPRFGSLDAAREAAHAGWPLAAEPVTEPSVPRAELAPRVAAADAIWRRMEDEGVIRLIDPWDAFCDDTTCHAVHDGVGQYFDNNHVTNSAARRVQHLFAPIFQSAQDDAATRGTVRP